MLGQLGRNRTPVLDHTVRAAARSSAELLFQPRFCLADLSLVAVQATAARPRLGSSLHRFSPARLNQARLNQARLNQMGRETATRDVGRDATLLRQACRIAAGCSDAAGPVLSLRVTEAQAASGMLAGLIGDVLCATALPPGRMELEFCEGSLQTDQTDFLYTLAALRDLGVGLVLGGFGSGVSSLTLLRRRSLAGLLSGLKLDELLLEELPPDQVPQGDGFFQGLTASAHALGLVVLAEGIETEQQYRRLRDAGCDQGLGSWLGAPRQVADGMADWSGWTASGLALAQPL